MIPRLKPLLGGAELAAALRPPRPDDLSRFEAAFADAMGQSHALAFPYGRTGLFLLLKAMGLSGREILCPAYTCVVVAHAVNLSGNTPVFVDCGPDSCNMDLDLAGAAVTENTGAVLATSLFGVPVDLDHLDRFREAHPHVAVIQDCAHSFGCLWRGRPVCREGAAALYGLNISKTLTSVFGGMLTTDDHALHRELTRLRDKVLTPGGAGKALRRLIYLAAVYPTFWEPLYGLVNRMERSGMLDTFTAYYDETVIDMPSDHLRGMTRLEARVGLANLGRYKEILRRRSEAADTYFESLAFGPDLVPPPRVPGATYSHFSIRVAEREGLLRAALGRSVQLGCIPEYSIPEMRAYGGHPPEDFPRAADWARRVVNLPVWGGAPVARRVLKRLKGLLPVRSG